MKLTQKHCVPCEGWETPFDQKEARKYLRKVSGWELVDGKKIKKQFKFKDFKEAMKFVNQVADLAEKEGHHPDIYIYYNKVRFELTTHAIGGLSENDFILAAKIDTLAK